MMLVTETTNRLIPRRTRITSYNVCYTKLLRSAQGKKGRPVTIFHLLTDPDLRERCCERIFQETSTIGLRWSVMNRMVLPRKERRTEEGMRLKDALRPNGDLTTKLESDELDSVADLASRRRIKVVAEDFPND